MTSLNAEQAGQSDQQVSRAHDLTHSTLSSLASPSSRRVEPMRMRAGSILMVTLSAGRCISWGMTDLQADHCAQQGVQLRHVSPAGRAQELVMAGTVIPGTGSPAGSHGALLCRVGLGVPGGAAWSSMPCRQQQTGLADRGRKS